MHADDLEHDTGHVPADDPAHDRGPRPEDRPGSVSKVFASAADEARVRRPADAVALAATLLFLAVGAWAHRSERHVGGWVADIVDGAPDWLQSLAIAIFAATGIAGLALTAIVMRLGRLRLVRDIVVAAVLTLIAALRHRRDHREDLEPVSPACQSEHHQPTHRTLQRRARSSRPTKP